MAPAPQEGDKVKCEGEAFPAGAGGPYRWRITSIRLVQGEEEEEDVGMEEEGPDLVAPQLPLAVAPGVAGPAAAAAGLHHNHSYPPPQQLHGAHPQAALQHAGSWGPPAAGPDVSLLEGPPPGFAPAARMHPPPWAAAPPQQPQHGQEEAAAEYGLEYSQHPAAQQQYPAPWAVQQAGHPPQQQGTQPPGGGPGPGLPPPWAHQ